MTSIHSRVQCLVFDSVYASAQKYFNRVELIDTDLDSCFARKYLTRVELTNSVTLLSYYNTEVPALPTQFNLW